MAFVDVLGVAELPAGRATTVTVNDANVALYNVDGTIYATRDSCPHAGSSLGWGILEGNFVKCRAHGLRFDVRTGQIAGSSSVSLPTYPVQMVGDRILVDLGGAQ